MGPYNWRTPKPLLVGEDDGKAALVAQHDDLRVRALRQLVGDLDRLPLQELRADALGDDRLEVRDALSLDALAIRLLPLTVEHEAHPLRLLFGLELLLDGGGQEWRQLHVAEQHLLGFDAARAERSLHVLEDVLRDLFALRRVEELCLVLRGHVPNGRAQLRLDDDLLELAADGLVYLRRDIRPEPEEERDVEVDDQTFGGGNRRGFLDLAGLRAELEDARSGHDEADARSERTIGDRPEEVLHPDVTGRYHGRGKIEHEEDDQPEPQQPNVVEPEASRD